MKTIGLTGGIASGKSTAARVLETLGAFVIDADRLGHQVYEPESPGFRAVVEAFGADIVDAEGQIDRRALGGKVFEKPDELRRLTDIVWPEIRRLAETAIAEHAANEPDGVVVLEAAVLFEASWEDLVDEIWVVSVDVETAIERLRDRNQMSREDAMARIESQLSNAEREARADVTIENSGSEDELRSAIKARWV